LRGFLKRAGALWICCLLAAPLPAELTPEQKEINLASFEKVWSTIRDKHWETNPGGLDWNAIHEEFRPKIERAGSMEEARTVLREMLSRLKQTHFAIVPASVYDDVEPAIPGAMEARLPGDNHPGDGSAGIDARVLDGQAVVVRVDPGSPAEQAGVKAGWEIDGVNGVLLAPLIHRLRQDPAIPDLTLARAVQSHLEGPPGDTGRFAFLDGSNHLRVLPLVFTAPRGERTSFGNLPSMRVWFESRRLGNTGYVAFNAFLDLVRVMAEFGDFIQGCGRCDGLIVDLRGNPGGIGGMAMGMAGWLINQPDQRLGVMVMRDVKLNFVINPRASVFTGPVAILVDGSSASTSEIFAGGLKDLGRARVFGTHTAAAALPSVFERLPNGDGFQYAVANYISAGGQPLEGIGVTPDVEVKLTREALLSGHDPVLDAALEWIRERGKAK